MLRGLQESASDTSDSKDGILGSLGEISTSANPLETRLDYPNIKLYKQMLQLKTGYSIPKN